MGKPEAVRELVERVVSVSLATHVSALKDELIERTCEELKALPPEAAPAPAAAPATPPGGAPTDLLNAAFSSVLDSSLQADILGALVEGAGKFAERVALFVIRAGAATGWRARGLNANDAIKNLAIDISSGVAARAVQDRVPASASAAEFDDRFVAAFGAPAEGTNALVLPLVIRDKVSALVYADAGPAPAGMLDPSALECLVRGAALWLEVVGARKSGTPVATEPAPAPEPVAPAPPAAVVTPPPVVAAPPPPPPPPPPSPAPAPVMTPTSAAAAAAPAPVPAPAAVPAGLSPDEEEIHKKAKRFAKLLVDEIKLYNKIKVEEGRGNKNIYARLKDDIDKSRGAYDKRYGQSAAASADYFTQELIRILCEGDSSLLGGGFSR